jgi:hypothetical protein
MNKLKNKLTKLATDIREYAGVRRKVYAGRLCQMMNVKQFGDDAAVIDVGLEDEYILFAADGVWETVLEADPWWGGFVSILVNVHDIYAMGGKPLYASDIMSFVTEDDFRQMVEGIRNASQKYSVPVITGHIHPFASQNSISVSMVGKVKKESLIRSNTASPGDDIVVAIDTEGEQHPKLRYNFDSTKKDPEVLMTQLESMVELGRRKAVTAGKDISNAGVVGTAAMMLEVSGVGGGIDIQALPKPENVSLEDWLKTYPGCGFVVAAEDGEEAVRIFRKHGLDAAVVGQVDDSKRVRIRAEGREATVFDFSRESMLGLK